MKKLLLLISIIYWLSLSLFSQSCQWVERIGGLIYDDSRSIAVDSKGNVIVVGKFYSTTLNFNNGITVNKVGDADVYLTKYDSNGTCLWAQVIGGEGEETVNSICVDQNNDIYIAGSFMSTKINLNNGDSLKKSMTSAYDAFLIKFNTDGKCLWKTTVSGTNMEDIYKVIADNQNNIFITGWSNSPVYIFDGAINRTGMGDYDGFYARYDSDGHNIWVQSIGGSGPDFVTSIAAYSSNNLYISGEFSSPSILIGNITLNNSGGIDGYLGNISKLNGVPLDVVKFGGTEDDGVLSIESFGDYLYVFGEFFSTTLELSPSITLTNSGDRDIFLARYSTINKCEWAEKIAGTGGDYAFGLAVDKNESIYLASFFNSPTLEFNNGKSITNNGNFDGFLAKYNSNGVCQWADKVAGSNQDYIYSIAVDNKDNFYITGYYGSPTLSLNNNKSLPKPAGVDGFISKFSINSTGVNVVSSENKLIITPNPATDYIEIQNPEHQKIEIMNIFGESVNFTPAFSINGDRIKIEISGLSSGLYFVKLGDRVSKFVKM